MNLTEYNKIHLKNYTQVKQLFSRNVEEQKSQHQETKDSLNSRLQDLLEHYGTSHIAKGFLVPANEQMNSSEPGLYYFTRGKCFKNHS